MSVAALRNRRCTDAYASLLGLVTSDGSNDAVLLSLDAVPGTLDVGLGVCGFDLSWKEAHQKRSH